MSCAKIVKRLRPAWLAALAGSAVLVGLAPALGSAQGMMGGGMPGHNGMMAGGMMAGGMMGGGMMNGESPRRTYYMRHGVPAAYATLANPLPATPDNLAAGRRLYEQMCVACHGTTGRGEGVAGQTLDPRPSDLAQLVRMPMARDGYLYWAIAEGGAPFGTAMPAMKGTWKTADIWKVILYLRTL